MKAMSRVLAGLTALALSITLGAAGCQHSDPCWRHGGTKYTVDIDGGWYYKCNDGTLV